MQYTLRRDERNYLEVKVSGAPSETESRALLLDMVKAYRDSSITASLLEVKVAYGLDPASVKGLVIGLPAMGFPSHYRIAILLMDEVARESAEFAEDVAVNRGIEMVRVFREREAALAWIAS